MGLSVENQQRAFLALNQMMSKGTIQAEELRGQLGEALPGAFGIMAKAVGVTEQELAKMMKAGQLLASDVLPKFARQLEKTYGIETLTRVENLTGSQNRLTNAWRSFVASLDKDGNKLSNFFKKTLDVATDVVKGIELIFESSEEKRKRTLKSIRDFAYNEEKKTLQNMDEARKQNAISEREYNRERIVDIKKEIESLKNRNKIISPLSEMSGKKGTFSDMQKEAYNVRKYRKEIVENNKEIYKLTDQLQYNIGVRQALDEALVENIKNQKQETKVIKETEEEREKRIKKLREEYIERTEIEKLNQSPAVEGYLAKLKAQKSAFEGLQQQLSNTSAEYKRFQDVIDGIQTSIDLIEDPSKVIKSDGINEFMRIYSNRVKTGLDETKGFWEKYGQEVTDLSQELVNTLAEISNARFENQLINLQKERDVAILFAGESVSAREEVERQYEARRSEIQRRQAEAQKRTSMFNIVVDTAQAVIATLAQTPPPAGIPLAVLVGAIGAAQLALVASQPIPQFWQGTDNAPEGLAWTQEKGREIITDKSGKIKSLGSDKGAQLTMLDKGDKVFTAEKSALMFDNGLNSILANNGISMPKIEVNFETEKITNEIKSLSNAILKKEGLTIIKNAKGEKVYLRKQGETKELLNSVINYKTINV